MKILFVIPTYKPAYVYGGPIVVVAKLAETLAASGKDITVYTTTANGAGELEVETGKELMIDKVKVVYFKRLTKDHTHISPQLWSRLAKTLREFDIVHLHSWWSPAMFGVAAICKLKGVKPLLSPHGMFCDYVLDTNNRRKKQLMHQLVGKVLLKNTFLHVSTPMEWNECQTIMNGKWLGAIIPNVVELSSPASSVNVKKEDQPFLIGFLSRIDPKKGVDILIKALSKVNFSYRLQIAGSGEESYIEYLKEIALSSGNSDKIDWVGWKNNDEKFDFYKSVNLFALTSHNENFAVVVLESLSVGTPVLLSENVGLADYVRAADLGWTTDISNIKQVTQVLEQAYSDHSKRANISRIAPDLIRRDYNKNLLASRYLGYYTKMLGA